jgi:hypothetical protein
VLKLAVWAARLSLTPGVAAPPRRRGSERTGEIGRKQLLVLQLLAPPRTAAAAAPTEVDGDEEGAIRGREQGRERRKEERASGAPVAHAQRRRELLLLQCELPQDRRLPRRSPVLGRPVRCRRRRRRRQAAGSACDSRRRRVSQVYSLLLLPFSRFVSPPYRSLLVTPSTSVRAAAAAAHCGSSTAGERASSTGKQTGRKRGGGGERRVRGYE